MLTDEFLDKIFQNKRIHEVPVLFVMQVLMAVEEILIEEDEN